jgi:hypothetical protein
MNIKQLLETYYQILINDNSKIYDKEGIRSKVSSEVTALLNILDDKERQGIDIDNKIFPFLSFISGYDTPRYEDEEYLYNNTDLEREYAILGDIDALDGIKTEI